MKHNWRYIAGIGISRAPIHIHEPRRFPRVTIRRNDYYGGKAKEERRARVVHPIRPRNDSQLRPLSPFLCSPSRASSPNDDGVCRANESECR